MGQQWKNWSGSLRFIPGQILLPESEEEVSQIVKQANARNQKIRVVGAGHSSSPLVQTDNILISLKHFKGVEAEAEVLLSVFYEDEPPATYKVKVPAKRLKKIRFNDLIDPAAIQMERNFACYLRSDVPVVVQFSRMNTGAKANAEMGSLGFPVNE